MKNGQILVDTVELNNLYTFLIEFNLFREKPQ